MQPLSHAGLDNTGGLRLNIFTDEGLDRLHTATLSILEEIGLFVEDEAAMDLFAGGGAIVDIKTKIVKLPGSMVDDALRFVPSTHTLAARSPGNDVIVGGNTMGFTNYGKAVLMQDPDSDKTRQSLSSDVARIAKLVDYADNLDVYVNAATAHDLPQKNGIAQLYNARIAFENTCKNIFIAGAGKYTAEKLIEMAAVVAGGRRELRKRPLLTFVASPVTPLKLIKECCQDLICGAKAGIPVNIISMAMAGATSPTTMAGTIAVHNAEVLGATVLTQLVCKGAPVIYGSSTTAMDLRFGTVALGSPECSLINAALAKLAQHYSIPSFVAGVVSDSKLSDIQNGHEKTVTGLLPAIAGADLLFGAGIIDTGMTFSLSQLLIDNEFAGLIKYAANGIPVNAETLALDVIRDTAHFGNVLEHEHTYKHMKRQSQPAYMDRMMRENWERSGRAAIKHKTAKDLRKILRDHHPEPLAEEVKKSLGAIIEGAEKELGVI